MIEAASTPYIVAIPGSDTPRELSREALLAEMAKGVITPQFWVWSPEAQDWTQISEVAALRVPLPPTPLPTLQPKGTSAARVAEASSSPLVLAPVAATPKANPISLAPLPTSTPKASSAPRAPLPSSLPKVTPIAPITPVASSARKAKKSVYRRSHRVEEHPEGFSYTKFLFGLLYVIVAVVVGLNYLLVDKPFGAALADTPYILVPAHAHLGSFVQPNALIIHILPNHEVTDGNFPDVLYTLAKGTPNQPFQERPYEMVALTSQWFGQFAMRGPDWQQLGQMNNASSAERKNFITDHLGNIAGEPLIRHADQLAPDDLKAARAQVWQGLMQDFLSKS
jgi:hypothetical protein